MELADVPTGSRANRFTFQSRKGLQASLLGPRGSRFGMNCGKVSVVFRAHIPAGVFFHVPSAQNPFTPQGGKSLFHVASLIRVAPGPARLINTNRLVRLDLP